MDEQAKGTAVKPRSYTEDYKRQVVDLVTSTGRTASSVAAEVGLHHTLLSRWVKRYGERNGAAAAAVRPALTPSLKPLPVSTADQAAEPDAEHLSGIARLRRERDILEKGNAIFAVPCR